VSSFQFASGQSALKIPFELSNNLVLLQSQVNDSQPLWFIFDTGANSSLIDARMAKRLKLQAKGRAQGSASRKGHEEGTKVAKGRARLREGGKLKALGIVFD
jgi:hypothetical protein